jgi:hypothetical protein
MLTTNFDSDPLDVAICALNRHAGTKARDDTQVVGATLLAWKVGRERKPELGSIRRRRAAKYDWRRRHIARWHHPDYPVWDAVDRDSFTKRLWTGAESPAPEAVGQQDDRHSPRAILLFEEESAQRWLNAEHSEQRRCHRGPANLFRLTSAERYASPAESADAFERPISRYPVV